MILPIFKNRGFKINSEHSYFGEINEKALYHMAYNYFQDPRLKKGLVKFPIPLRIKKRQ